MELLITQIPKIKKPQQELQINEKSLKLKLCLVLARISMILDFPFIFFYLSLFVIYTTCIILNYYQGEDQKFLEQFFFPKQTNFDVNNRQMLLKYINRIMMLLIIDVFLLLIKSYWAVYTLLAAKYQPTKERRYFNQYFMISVSYYVSQFFKYGLIIIAFHSTVDKIDCFFVTIGTIMGAIGSFVFTPCIWVALIETDKRHIVLVKGAMRAQSQYEVIDHEPKWRNNSLTSADGSFTFL